MAKGQVRWMEAAKRNDPRSVEGDNSQLTVTANTCLGPMQWNTASVGRCN
jgi:hypothetical protein